VAVAYSGALGHGFGNLLNTYCRPVAIVNLILKRDEDSGKEMIYKMAHERDEDSKDMKAGTLQ